MVYVIVDKNTQKKIEKDYKKGKTYKDIEKKYGIGNNQLLYIIKKNKWKRESNRSKVKKGNKNAKGNKGGRAPKKNKNALITGAYETIFKDTLDEDELNIYNSCSLENRELELLEEIKLLTIRERRIMQRIANVKNTNKDMTITSITRNKSTTSEYGGITSENSSTYVEATDEKIQRFEEALTRVQEAKRRAIESYHRIENDKNRFELELLKFEKEVAADEPPDYTSDEISSNNLIQALNSCAKEVWSNDN